ncbi:MAG: Holliday junction branch migration protein RuvA, partial [Deltaproteobacteria bacterium]
MIHYIGGKLVEKSSNLAIIENNGIGYNINISS